MGEKATRATELLGSVMAACTLVFKYLNECFVIETELWRGVCNPLNVLRYNLIVG